MPARCTASLAVLNNAALFRSHVPGSSAAYGLRHDRSKTADTSLWKPRATSNQVPAFLRRHCLQCERLLLYWAYQIFSGGRRSDCTDNANREQPLPHLRRAHAEYLLLQMTGEHELQSMESEIRRYCTECAPLFLFAAVPVESWNDALSPWEAPCRVGKARFQW